MFGAFSITCASCAYRWREEVPRAASCLWEKCYVKLTGSASWVTTYKHLPAPQHIQLCQKRPHRKSRTLCWYTCSTCSFFWQRRNNSWVSRWVQASVVSYQNQESDLFPFFQSFFFLFFLFNLQDSPLFSLLVQSTSLPWHKLDLSSYQSILGYVSTHYPPSLLLSADSAPQLLLKSLRSAAGLHPCPGEAPHQVRRYNPVCFLHQIC